MIGGLAFIVGRDIIGEEPATTSSSPIHLESSSASFTDGDDQDARLNIHLSKGQEEPDVDLAIPVVTGDPLTAEEIQRILNRLPSLTTGEEDVQEFNLPDSSPPAKQFKNRSHRHHHR
jgi:hypothetical protein